MHLLFNPIYRLKKDNDRVLLLHVGGLQPIENQHDEGFCGFIHPLHAIILSFLNGDEYDEIIQHINEFIKIDESFIKKFIYNLLNKNTKLSLVYKNVQITFPANTIIESDKKRDIVYNPQSFLLDTIDLRPKRPISVSKLTFMLNNKCKTNCFYCYADKRKIVDCSIPLERYKELIKEAYSLGVVSIDLIGGEIFLYKHWKELLTFLKEYHYNPLISTKMPLEEDIIKHLHSTGVTHIQISLDTLIADILKNTLSVNDAYINKIKKTFLLLERYNIKIAIHSIITQKNCLINSINSIYDFIKTSKNVLYWKLDVGGESMYVKPEINKIIVPSPESINNILPHIKEISKNSNFPIIYSGLENTYNTETTVNEKIKHFNNRSFCSGNFLSLFILPDGKVTMCEELYWHPKFILGDVNKQSIQEIWSSSKANSLYNISQKDISEKSKCKHCKDFYTCRSIRQVCYRDIIKKYGDEHWDFPDPKCPYN